MKEKNLALSSRVFCTCLVVYLIEGAGAQGPQVFQLSQWSILKSSPQQQYLYLGWGSKRLSQDVASVGG